MKYILVTGGVISGIGKGVISSSIGALLKGCGLHVTSIKIDPYLNIDAVTFSPYEHGKVLFFVHLLSNERLIAPLHLLRAKCVVQTCPAIFIRVRWYISLELGESLQGVCGKRILMLCEIWFWQHYVKKIPKCNMRRKL